MKFAKKSFDFMAHRKTFWLISLAIFAVGLIFNIIFGTELDIQFTGGAMFKYSYSDGSIVSGADVSGADISAADVSATTAPTTELPSGESADTTALLTVAAPTASDTDAASGSDVSASDVSASDTAKPIDINDIELTVDESLNVDADETVRIVSAALGKRVEVSISDSSTEAGKKNLVVTLADGQSNSADYDETIRAIMLRKYPNVKLALRESNSVDATMGTEFFWKCIVAIALASVFMVLYVGFRFRKIGGWTAGASSIIAILHDCAVVYFTFVIFRFPLDDNFIAVVLAMIGYSLNSTIVIFDRTRENRKLLSPKTPVAELANISMNETLGRTINTNLCVFAAVATVAVVSMIFSIDSIISFAVPMMFGTISGCYSSLCISNTIWVTWQEKLEQKRAGTNGRAKTVRG